MKGYCGYFCSALLPLNSVLKLMFCLRLFCLRFERVAGFHIAKIIPILVNKLSTDWQALNLQNACYSHKNVILNETNTTNKLASPL